MLLSDLYYYSIELHRHQSRHFNCLYVSKHLINEYFIPDPKILLCCRPSVEFWTVAAGTSSPSASPCFHPYQKY